MLKITVISRVHKLMRIRDSTEKYSPGHHTRQKLEYEKFSKLSVNW